MPQPMPIAAQLTTFVHWDIDLIYVAYVVADVQIHFSNIRNYICLYK